MRRHKQSIILDSLSDVREQIGEVETLLSNGDHLAALHQLLQSRNHLRQVVVTLMVACVQENLEVVKGEDSLSYETRLRNLAEIVNFALLELCPDCQHRIGIDLKEYLLNKRGKWGVLGGRSPPKTPHTPSF